MPSHAPLTLSLAALLAPPLTPACAAVPSPHERVLQGPAAAPGVTFFALLHTGEVHDVTSTSALPCGTRAVEARLDLRSEPPGAVAASRMAAARSALEVRATGGLSLRPGAPARLLLDVDPLLGAFVGHELTLGWADGTPPLAASWKQDISCHGEVNLSARSGQRPLTPGEDGPRLNVHVTKVRSSSLGPVTFVIIEGTGKPLYSVAPLGARITIHAHGGDGGPGGQGGHGGKVEVEVDERFPELHQQVTWQARGGSGAAGSRGQEGEGSVLPGDVLLTLIARSDLPAGLSLMDTRTLAKKRAASIRRFPRPPRPLPPLPPLPSPQPPRAKPAPNTVKERDPLRPEPFDSFESPGRQRKLMPGPGIPARTPTSADPLDRRL